MIGDDDNDDVGPIGVCVRHKMSGVVAPHHIGDGTSFLFVHNHLGQSRE